MRIGIVVAEFPSYSETFFINKVIGLCERGHEVIVFRVNRHQNEVLEDLYSFKKYPNLQIVSFDFNATALSRISAIIRHPWVCIKNAHINMAAYKKNIYYNLCLIHFKKYRCDVFHFGYSGLAVYYYSLFNSLERKIMVSCLGTAEKVKALADPVRKDKLKLVFNRANSIHCVSADMAEAIKYYGAAESKTYINRPAIDTDFFSRKNEYKKSGHLQILSIGRFVFQKGFVLGLMAVYELSKQFENFTWKIAGEGADMEEMIFHINNLKLNDKVELLGKKTKYEIRELYEQSDIFFLPSVCEGIANVVLEAMSMELPVVSSDAGGMGEAISNGANGLLFANYDQLSMTAALLQLCNDFELRKTLGAAARKTAVEHFSLKRYIDVFEAEYQRLID